MYSTETALIKYQICNTEEEEEEVIIGTNNELCVFYIVKSKIHNTAAKPEDEGTSFAICIKSIILQLYDTHVDIKYLQIKKRRSSKIVRG